VGQGVVRVCIRGVADTAASLSSVKMSAPASGGAEARSGARAHWTRARAGLVGDDVDPHPHVGQALRREQRLKMGHSVQLRLSLPPDLHEQLHLVLLPTSSSSS